MEYDGILAERFIQEYPSKAAEVLEGLSDEEIAAFFQDSPIEIVVPVLNLMNDYRLAKSFSLLPEELASHLLENALVAKIESLLRQFDEPFRNTLLDKLSLGLAAALRTKLKQEAHSVGALMQPVTLTFNVEMSIKEAVELLRKNQEVVEALLYVVDSQGNLEGTFSLKDLFLVEESDTLISRLNREIPRVYPDVAVDEIIDSPVWEQHGTIPVVERSGKLIGTISYPKLRKGIPEEGGQSAKQLIETSSALGELYRIGLTGFLQSVGR